MAHLIQGRSAPRFARSLRRKTSWSAGPRGHAQQTAAGTTVFSVTAVAGSDALTIVRTRGEFTAWLSAVAAILDGFQQIGAGICIVSENAAGIGITAIPHPLADIAWDGWLWYWTGTLQSANASGASLAGPGMVRIPIDSKAMRKIKETDVIVGVFESISEVGTPTVQMNMESRILVKLP